MQLLLLGLNHNSAPVEVREQLALSPSRLPLALRGLREQCGAREAAILSTCNRAEIYAIGSAEAAPRMEKFLSEFHHISARGLHSHLYHSSGGASARHLFRVASGVDSLVLGESQILGQVKSALEAARQSGTVAGSLDELFRRAISCGKRAREETQIGRGALSIGSAAVELARQILGPLEGHTVLILGAGKMSALTAQHLVASGARRVVVSNRTRERAEELASQFGDVHTEIADWSEFSRHLVDADIVISSTRAPHFVLSADTVAQAMKARRQRPLFLVDIAVPRDIDPKSHELDNVYLYDIDDLQSVVQGNRAQRQGELERVESIVEDEVSQWERWYRARDAQPVMAGLARRAGEIRDREVENALAQLPRLTAKEQEVVRVLAKQVASKIMHAPLRHLREAGGEGSPDVDALRRAFALEDTPQSKVENDRTSDAEASE
ncbi:MAG TPA: glutamyl-tRNA reductase [Abditibacteriaceae bacterium]